MTEVRITETLCRTILVPTDNEKEAIDIVKQMYRNEEIVLDYSDFVDVDFEIYPN